MRYINLLLTLTADLMAYAWALLPARNCKHLLVTIVTRLALVPLTFDPL